MSFRMGVYGLANQSPPVSVADPASSVKGQALYDKN
jgi:hypothetical protein